MRNRSFLLAGAITLAILAPTQAQENVESFMGRWALHLPGGAGWLEVHDRDGFLDASLLWYGGSVLPVAGINISDGTLTVTRTYPVAHEIEGGKTRRHIVTNRVELTHNDSDGLSGTAYFPNRSGIGQQTVQFAADRIPDLPPTPDKSAIEYGEPIEIFNGTDLKGWSLTNSDQTNGFIVEDGVLVNNPVQPDDDSHISYGNLRTDAVFEDFRLTLDFNIPEGSNSGVYLRGIYEVQVADTYGQPLDSHNMGGLYSRIAPSTNAERPAGEWQTYDITLYQRHLTVILNGTTIIDNQPVLGVTGGALTADESKPGPIYLQGDHGRVFYRNMVLTPIFK